MMDPWLVRAAWLKLFAVRASDLTHLRPEYLARVLNRANDNQRERSR
jgi:hypothetical protein